MATIDQVTTGQGGHAGLQQRRAILNALTLNRPLHLLNLPQPVLSWHLIWLHHARLIRLTPDGPTLTRPRQHAA